MSEAWWLSLLIILGVVLLCMILPFVIWGISYLVFKDNKGFQTSALNRLKGKWGISIGAMGITLGIGLVFTALPTAIFYLPESLLFPDSFTVVACVLWCVAIVSWMIYGMVLTLFQFSMTRFCFNLYQTKDMKVSDVFWVWRSFDAIGKAIGSSIMISLMLFLWSLLLFIPAIIMGYAYSLTWYILIDEPEMSIFDAIMKSQKLMKGNKLRLFWLKTRFVGWYMLSSSFSNNLGSIAIVPYVNMTVSAFYEEVKREKEVTIS